MQIQKVYQYWRLMESKIQKRRIRTNIKKKKKKKKKCNYGYTQLCDYDNFSEPFRTYLDKDPVHNFINSRIEEITNYSEVMKNLF